jgi:hypothetical protein
MPACPQPSFAKHTFSWLGGPILIVGGCGMYAHSSLGFRNGNVGILPQAQWSRTQKPSLRAKVLVLRA